MPSPIITFRLSPYQLARGLQIVRSLEPDFKLMSLSQLAKICYSDYLAKMTLGQTDEISQEIMAEINDFIISPSKKSINLESLINIETHNFAQANQILPLQNEEEQSIKSTVTDFSPPKDWMDSEE